MKRYLPCLLVALAGCGRVEPNRPPESEADAPPPALIPPENDSPPVVITQAEEDAIRKLLEDFRAHTARPEVGVFSHLAPYLDCPAHRALLGYGLKAVPYLIEQAGRMQAVDVTLGAVAIGDPAISTPDQVVAYNRERRAKCRDTTLPSFVLVAVLSETPAGEAEEAANRDRDGPPGTRHSDAFSWVEWWRTNKGRFEFRTNRPPVIPLPERGVYYGPHVTTTARGRLLDLHAVSATYRDIIARAAAELGLDVFVGKHQHMDFLTTMRVEGVTFEEFLHILSADSSVYGLKYRKTATGYHVGGEEPARPRDNLWGWGIMMRRTVFGVGDEIPVTVITRGTDPLMSPDDPAFLGSGSFQVTRNDGSVVVDYRPVEPKPPTLPLLERKEDLVSIRVSLGRYCRLQAGEYNLRFRYREHETPSVAIEVYDRPVKK